MAALTKGNIKDLEEVINWVLAGKTLETMQRRHDYLIRTAQRLASLDEPNSFQIAEHRRIADALSLMEVRGYAF